MRIEEGKGYKEVLANFYNNATYYIKYLSNNIMKYIKPLGLFVYKEWNWVGMR